METLEKMITRSSYLETEEPSISRISLLQVTIVNSNYPSGIDLLPAPNINYAIWNNPLDEVISANLTVSAGVYLPLHDDFNLKSIKCERCEPDTKGVAQAYQISFDFPDSESFDYYQLYTISFTDFIDVKSIGDDGTQFFIEVFLKDTDPKTSRGTVTTVLKSA